MPKLWDPTWTVGSLFKVRRQYTSLFVVGWNNAAIIQTGRTTILQETIFGGYRFHLTFKPYFWEWSSSAFIFDDLIEDIFVTPPGTSTPISCGPVNVRWGVLDPTFRHGPVFDMAGVDRKYYFFALPTPDAPFWYVEDTPIPPMPYIYAPP